MKLIVGLGNIGPQYAKTRHNAGFMVIDELASILDAQWRDESKFKASIAEGWLAGGTGPNERIVFAKPHTMMNLSGEAIQRIMQFYKIALADVWVIFDDVDVPFGRLRIRRGGSGSGHQGVNSLIHHIGSDFLRLKFGISLNDRAKEPSEVYVLKQFNADERAKLPHVIPSAAQLITGQLARETPEESTFDL